MGPSFYKLTVLPESGHGILERMEENDWVVVQASNEPREYLFLVAQLNYLKRSIVCSNPKLNIEYFSSNIDLKKELNPALINPDE